MQAAVQGTNFYESYTGVVLPLPKLDMVAIPGRGGAVENWGLIQFDERRMLVNEVCLSMCLLMCAFRCAFQCALRCAFQHMKQCLLDCHTSA